MPNIYSSEVQMRKAAAAPRRVQSIACRLYARVTPHSTSDTAVESHYLEGLIELLLFSQCNPYGLLAAPPEKRT